MKKGIVILLGLLLLCSAVYAVEYTTVPTYMNPSLPTSSMPVITLQCNDGWDNDGDHRIDYYGGCDVDKDGFIDYICGCDENYDESISRSEALTGFDDCFLAEFGCLVDGVFSTNEICSEGNLYWPDPNCTDFVDDKEKTLDGEEEAEEIVSDIMAIEPDYPDFSEPNIIDRIVIKPYFPYFKIEEITDKSLAEPNIVIENDQEVISNPTRGLFGFFMLDVVLEHPLGKLK